MKITKTQLKQIIKEELESVLEAEPAPPQIGVPRPSFQGATRSKRVLRGLYDAVFKKEFPRDYKKMVDMHTSERGLPTSRRYGFEPREYTSGGPAAKIVKILQDKEKMQSYNASPLTDEEVRVLTGIKVLAKGKFKLPADYEKRIARLNKKE